MSVKIKAKNANNILQTLTCDNNGVLNTNAISSFSKQTLTLLNITLSQNQDSASIDCRGYRQLRIWGYNNTNNNLMLEFSDNGTNFFRMTELYNLDVGGVHKINELIDCPPKYVRISNINAQMTMNLYFVLQS